MQDKGQRVSPLRRHEGGPLCFGAGGRNGAKVRAHRRTEDRVLTQDQLRGMLEEVRSGAVGIDAALERMRHLPFEDLGYAKLDHHRALRHGLTEVIFGKGKTPDQVKGIAERLLDKSPNLLVTRADREIADAVKEIAAEAEYFPLSGAVRIWRERKIHGKGVISVVSACTSDIP